MASKDAPKPAPATDPARTLAVITDGKKSRARLIAEVALTPAALNANTTQAYARGVVGTAEFTELVDVLREKAAKVKAGDLSELEAMLTAQASTLDTIFNELARRASLNMSEYLNATDTYMRLALKAQSQCRTTIEAIAEIKNPRPVAFVKQANIAHGPQQVNNTQNARVRAHAENSDNQSNELSRVTHELPAHVGAPPVTRQADTAMATVGTLDRATHD